MSYTAVKTQFFSMQSDGEFRNLQFTTTGDTARARYLFRNKVYRIGIVVASADTGGNDKTFTIKRISTIDAAANLSTTIDQITVDAAAAAGNIFWKALSAASMDFGAGTELALEIYSGASATGRFYAVADSYEEITHQDNEPPQRIRQRGL